MAGHALGPETIGRYTVGTLAAISRFDRTVAEARRLVDAAQAGDALQQ